MRWQHPPYRHAQQRKEGHTGQVRGEPTSLNICEMYDPLIDARVPKMLRFRPAERPMSERKSDETDRRRDHGDSLHDVDYCLPDARNKTLRSRRVSRVFVAKLL